MNFLHTGLACLPGILAIPCWTHSAARQRVRTINHAVSAIMNEDPGREVAIFTDATKVSPAERAAFLEQACAGDEKLRRRVEGLLKAYDRIGTFLEEPPTGGPSNETH